MKTSTKLLIILFLSIPVSLWAYNIFLKKEFMAGNFTERNYFYERSYFQYKQLPEFKYLVIDGALASGDTVTKKDYMKNVDWMPRIGVNIVENKRNSLNIINTYSDILKTTVKNDTLYISFYKKVVGEKVAYYSAYPNENLLNTQKVLEINVTQLHTVKSRNAGVVINNPGKMHTAIDSLVIASTGRGKFDINNLKVNKLNILVKGTAQLCIYDNNNIGSLHYSVLQQGLMNVDAIAVKHFYPGKADSLARISISGNANDLKKMLK